MTDPWNPGPPPPPGGYPPPPGYPPPGGPPPGPPPTRFSASAAFPQGVAYSQPPPKRRSLGGGLRALLGVILVLAIIAGGAYGISLALRKATGEKSAKNLQPGMCVNGIRQTGANTVSVVGCSAVHQSEIVARYESGSEPTTQQCEAAATLYVNVNSAYYYFLSSAGGNKSEPDVTYCVVQAVDSGGRRGSLHQ